MGPVSDGQPWAFTRTTSRAPTRYEYLSADGLLALFDPSPGDDIADLGSGTGFYTDDVAPYAGTVHAVAVQPEMHDLYREKGMPPNVTLVTADAADLPFADGALHGAFSTMTSHEFASEAAPTTWPASAS